MLKRVAEYVGIPQERFRALWVSASEGREFAHLVAEMAEELGEKDDARKWRRIAAEWPDLAVDASGGLMFAPDTPYAESHRHFSHLMAIHPAQLTRKISPTPSTSENML